MVTHVDALGLSVTLADRNGNPNYDFIPVYHAFILDQFSWKKFLVCEDVCMWVWLLHMFHCVNSKINLMFHVYIFISSLQN